MRTQRGSTGVARRSLVFPMFRKDKLGQSAAIGTILAILVLLTILTVVTTRWIPVWVEGREADHAATVDAQFSEFKKTIDQQALSGVPGLSVGNPITLGQPGVPIFAPGSQGTINLGSYGNSLMANQLTFQNETLGFNQSAFGAVKYITLNSRFVQQQFIYEFGGVMVNQSDGQLMKVGPGISIDNASGNAQIRLTMISVAGDRSTFSGDSTVGIRTQLAFVPAVTQINYTTPEVFYLNITSEVASAWAASLNKSVGAKLNSTQFSISLDNATHTVSVRFALVDKIIVSYQVFKAELDIA